MHIREALSRRYDLSTFIIHLTRDYEDEPARNNLASILRNRKLEARSGMGIAKEYVKGHRLAEQSQMVVSFSEAPLDQLWLFVEDLTPPRRVHLSKYGIAFTRQRARNLGVNPVWYIDKTPGRRWLHGNLGDNNPLNKLIEDVRPEVFHCAPIAEITPFIEPMGTWATGQREFYWEREWRSRGDVPFGPDDVAFGFCPEGDIAPFEEWVRGRPEFETRKYPLRFMDPSWGMEEILAVLSGIDWKDISPFTKS
jgi:hypothetical protein